MTSARVVQLTRRLISQGYDLESVQQDEAPGIGYTYRVLYRNSPRVAFGEEAYGRTLDEIETWLAEGRGVNPPREVRDTKSL